MKELLKEKWSEIISYMRSEYGINDVAYQTWIAPLAVYDLKDDTLVISIDDTKNSIPVNYVEKKYSTFLITAIAEFTGNVYSLVFEKLSNLEKDSPSEFGTNRRQSPFNPLYTFDSFVVGPNNSMAHAAALAVAEDPGEVYNPLFIYGGPGLGKTHLMYSIANYLYENNKDLNILLIHTNDFTNELIRNIRNNNSAKNSMDEFKNKFMNADVLLVDDIQYIEGKNTTQEEFFHIFNSLYEAGKQIIITSDRPPKDLSTLNERFISRFEWGLNIDIQIPDYETRYAIINKKAEATNISIPDEVIKYMAENFTTNIRSLEGGLKKVIHTSRLSKRPITLDLAVEALRDMISGDSKKEITIPYIVDIVADYYKLTSTEIYSRNRAAKIAYARQIVMYLCKECMDTTFSDIGKALQRDHSSVMHGYDRIKKDCTNDPEVANVIDSFMRKIKR